jgi:methanogenic corrinoid protein MtbC1
VAGAAVVLRWRGWDVRYLGPNLRIEDLPETLALLKPRLLLFSATRPTNLEVLRELPGLLEKFPTPRPQVVVGGQALLSAPLPDGIPAIPAAAALGEAVRQIERLAGL